MNGEHTVDVAVVIPTIGRPSLRVLLDSLTADPGPRPSSIVVVDDRLDATNPLFLMIPVAIRDSVRVVRGRACGPAAARNDGWRSVPTTWVAFLDDDVVPQRNWLSALAADLAAAAESTGGVAGRIVVPLPHGREPTDWERNTAALETARWATADFAFRRAALIDVAGFDERFSRAYREDADLALRVREAGYELRYGTRHVVHPVRPAGRWISVSAQKGNTDDALMRALHGRRWREKAQVGKGRRRRHVAVTVAGVAGAAFALAGRRRLATATCLAWLLGTANFTRERIAPGPRDTHEVTTMAMTSALIPPLATIRWLYGKWRWREVRPWPDRPMAVLFDRDGTLIHDVPYNADPDRVTPFAGARAALDMLRSRGVRLGVVTNQSGVSKGMMTAADVDAINARVSDVLGQIDVFAVCVHDVAARCDCRKPAPGLITSAATILGAHPRHCVVIGDIGSDIEAAARAGARAILVPTPRTRRNEVASAPHVASDLAEAARLALRPEFMTGNGGHR